MTTKQLFHEILLKAGCPLAIRYWDGERIEYGAGSDRIALCLKDEQVSQSLIANLPVRFAEAYAAGAIDVEGPLQELVRLLLTHDFSHFKLGLRERARLMLLTWKQANTRRQAPKNVSHHYDLGNEFFSLWLGQEMAYSCAYFNDELDDIDTAQFQKFEHICRKLHLKEGELLLDIGCGWGGLLLHAAHRYGVRGLGITLSTAQKSFADQRVADAGLSDRVAIKLMDYRELEREGMFGAFDKVVSVGMLEHVGLHYYGPYFTAVCGCLRDGGGALVQSIGRRVGAEATPWIRKYIFPGMYLPSLSDLAAPAEQSGLYVTDVEVLRLHYALTLERWLDAFERNAPEIVRMYGEEFVRMWRLYLCVCISNFRYGELTLWQSTFTRGRNNGLPLTRAHLYRDADVRPPVPASGRPYGAAAAKASKLLLEPVPPA